MPQIALALCGDVMTGRGIDQILPNHCDPVLHEPSIGSAIRYVALAEARNGPIPRPVDLAYVWGDALEELRSPAIDARIVNLETSITTSADFADKRVHYRMHPANTPCIAAAAIDCCVLANNHVADFGAQGVVETLASLARAGIAHAGAGRDDAEACAPATKEIAGKGRVVVFGFGLASSGIPAGWKAEPGKPGVNLLPDLSTQTLDRLAAGMRLHRRPGDVAIASMHWGANWGYRIPREHVVFARGLIDAGFDVVHGHSSHHPKAIEIYGGKLIVYGCGDFLDDYEGITGYESFRDDLVLMYRPVVDLPNARLALLRLVPFQIRNFRLNRPSLDDARWLCERLNRDGEAFGTRFELKRERHTFLQCVPLS